MAEQRWAEARDAFATATRLDPQMAEAHANLGAVYLQLGDFAAAQTTSVRALAIEPALAVARRNLGLALLQLRRPAEAAVELARAHQAAPNDLIVIRALAFAHAQQGDLRDAANLARQGLRLNREDAELRRLLEQINLMQR